MSQIDYEGRQLVAVSNSENGDVGGQTVFSYHQHGDIVWATYGGGGIRFGTLIATADGMARLDARYSHVNAAGELMTGKCRTTPERLPDGRMRLHERWQWTSGDLREGWSVLEERAPPVEDPLPSAIRHRR